MFVDRLVKTRLGGVVPTGWEVVLIDRVAQRGSGHTPNKKVPDYWDGSIKWVSLKDSDKLDHVYIADTEERISEAGLANSSAVLHPPGTVILSRDAGVGKSAITQDQMAVSQHFIAWRCGKRLDNHYLYYWLQYMKPEFGRMAVGSTILTIGLPYFRKLRMLLPTLAEQKWIAGSLLTWDRAIEQTAQLIGAQRRRKQGLVQRLLTPSETPNCAWRRVQLGEIVDAVFRPVEWDENRVHRLASVRRWNGGLFDREALEGSEIKVKKLSRIAAGDLLISHIQAAYGAMAIVPEEFDGAHVSALYTMLRPRRGAGLADGYLAHLAATKRLWHLAYLASNGFFAERLRLNFDPDDFLRQVISIPADLDRQRAIARLLDTADVEIGRLAALLESMRIQKRALADQLLTGQRRVPMPEES